MLTHDKRLSRYTQFIFVVLFIVTLVIPSRTVLADLESFCDRLPRAAYKNLQQHHSSTEWFEVYQVEPNVWAIYEPFQWQEVISYLIVGNTKSLLFDTGNGMGDIQSIVTQLTDKPIQVLNSHSHFDHIGGNYQFDRILSPSTKFSIAKSQGDRSEQVKTEASKQALCKALPTGVTQKNHHIKPYTITRKIKDGDIIDLGGRQLDVLIIPGHTDDAVALHERETGLLWTGDSFYQGPIWLFAEETDLVAYQKSLARLVALVPILKNLLPAHNTPSASPSLLVEAQQALELVFTGKATAVPAWEGAVTFEFDGFGFLMRENYTTINKD